MLFCSQTHKFLRGKDLYVVLRETLSIERVLLLSVRPSYQRARSEDQGVPWWRRICQFRTSDQPNFKGFTAQVWRRLTTIHDWYTTYRQLIHKSAEIVCRSKLVDGVLAPTSISTTDKSIKNKENLGINNKSTLFYSFWSVYKYWYVTGEAIWQVTTEFHTLSRERKLWYPHAKTECPLLFSFWLNISISETKTKSPTFNQCTIIVWVWHIASSWKNVEYISTWQCFTLSESVALICISNNRHLSAIAHTCFNV